MTWIATRPFTDPEIAQAVQEGLAGLPREYSLSRRHLRRLPPAVLNDSIVGAHSLVPDALQHMFAGYGAMLDDKLPLSRRQHEMIAVTVSAINECYY